VIKTEVEKQEGCRRSVAVAVPPEAVRETYDRVVDAYARQGRIKGFRQGRAPRDLIEKRFAQQIAEDARDRVLPRYYREALEQEGIEPVALIDLEHAAFSKTDGLSFRVTVDTAPEFKLPRYRKLTLKVEPVEVTDQDVDQAVTSTREQFARFEDVTDRGVAAGDLVQVDYSGAVDGRPVAELVPDQPDIGQGEDFWVPVDEPEFVPGFNAGITGAAIGDQRRIEAAFPGDYRVEPLRGKAAVYTVTVKALRGRTLPELDAAFLKRLEVESVEDLRGRIREQLDQHAEQASRMRLRDEAASQLLAKADFEVPASVLERERQNVLRELVQNLVRSGESGEQLKARREELLGQADGRALERVRLSYLLAAIGREEQIGVSDAELEERLAALAARYSMPVDRFKSELEQREGGLDAIRQELQAERVMDFIVEHAKIKD